MTACVCVCLYLDEILLLQSLSHKNKTATQDYKQQHYTICVKD